MRVHTDSQVHTHTPCITTSLSASHLSCPVPGATSQNTDLVVSRKPEALHRFCCGSPGVPSPPNSYSEARTPSVLLSAHGDSGRRPGLDGVSRAGLSGRSRAPKRSDPGELALSPSVPPVRTRLSASRRPGSSQEPSLFTVAFPASRAERENCPSLEPAGCGALAQQPVWARAGPRCPRGQTRLPARPPRSQPGHPPRLRSALSLDPVARAALRRMVQLLADVPPTLRPTHVPVSGSALSATCLGGSSRPSEDVLPGPGPKAGRVTCFGQREASRRDTGGCAKSRALELALACLPSPGKGFVGVAAARAAPDECRWSPAPCLQPSAQTPARVDDSCPQPLRCLGGLMWTARAASCAASTDSLRPLASSSPRFVFTPLRLPLSEVQPWEPARGSLGPPAVCCSLGICRRQMGLPVRLLLVSAQPGCRVVAR